MYVELRFRIDGVDAGEAVSGYVPHKGMTVQLENLILGVAPGLYEVVQEPHGMFGSRGSRVPGRMRAGPVYVDVAPVPVADTTPGLSSQQGIR
jgi:hypothetical protein